MANKNRKNQNHSSANNKSANNQNNNTTNNQNDNTAQQFADTETTSHPEEAEGKKTGDTEPENTTVETATAETEKNTSDQLTGDAGKAAETNGEKGTQDSFQAGKLMGLVKKYGRYLAAGVLFVAMVAVLVKCTGPVTEDPKDPDMDSQIVDNTDASEEFQVDAIPEVNRLFNDYYTAHANGDVDAIEKVARPVSDTEKSFIKTYSEYVESYNNISCYTKSGLEEGEYVVSVYVDVKYKDVETQAPGLDRFYLRTDESGALYIVNAYSQFNQSNMEESTEADVQALLNEYEQAEDYITLWTNVQQRFEEALASDPELEKMANETIPNALQEWAQSLVETDGEPEDETENPDDGEEKPEESDDTPQEQEEQPQEEEPEKPDDNNSDGTAKTAYAMDGINLRKGPSTDDKVLAQITLGEELKIYPDTEKDGWVKASYDGKKGYVKREYVTTNREKVPEVEAPEENQPAKALPEGAEITLTGSVNVRVSMSETADKVGLAYEGDVVKVIMSYAEGWTKVEWNGQTGYIKTDLIK